MKILWGMTAMSMIGIVVMYPAILLYFAGFVGLIWVLEKALGESKPPP